MDSDAKPPATLMAEIQEIERSPKNPILTKLFESMLYELVRHFGLVVKGSRYVSEDNRGGRSVYWPMPRAGRSLRNRAWFATPRGRGNHRGQPV
jgi:hypothetical protein